MADTKISALTANSPAELANEIPVNDAGATKKVSLTDVKILVNTDPDFAAGSASAGTWPNLASGTLLTTAEAGAIERDAEAFYMTTDAGNRGVVRVGHIIRAASAQTLTSSASAQSIFDSPANGTITLETGIYRYELLLLVTGMSATSGNAEITYAGGGTFGGWLRRMEGLDAATPETIADNDDAFSTSATGFAASMVAAAVNTNLRLYEVGTFECSVAGTFIPSITLVTSAAATVAEGSYFICERWGAAAMASVGQWT